MLALGDTAASGEEERWTRVPSVAHPFINCHAKGALMTRPLHLTCIALVSCVLLSAIVDTASANRLSINRSTFKEKTPWRIEDGGVTITCPVTMKGSYHSQTFSKTEGSLVGFVTEATLRPCTGGRAIELVESLPWHYRYVRFTGTLPHPSETIFAITGLDIAVEAEGLSTCLASTEPSHPIREIYVLNEEGTVTSVRVDETSSIPLRGGFLCSFAGSAHVSGSGTITNQEETESLRLRLI